ncbi:1494_t:CDS:1, partial [Funneliformis mosseae]
LASLAYLLITVIAASAVIRIDDDLDNALEQRNTCATKCPFIFANAIFDPDSPKNEKVSEGPIKGFVVFVQDDEGSTTVTGYFSSGFKSTKNYKFLIVDHFDVVLDMTKRLNVTVHEGGTKAFTYTYDDISLDCDNEGILKTKADSSKTKVETVDIFLKIIENGNINSRARLLLKK